MTANRFTLYFAPGACSFVPHALLELAGAAFEPRMVKLHKGEQHSPDYLAVNPRAQVPVLVDSGHTITQILAITQHLDAAFPAADLLPKEAFTRTSALSLLAWMNNTAHPAFTHFFKPDKFTSDDSAQAAVREHARTTFKACLNDINNRLTDLPTAFLFGNEPSAPDLYALVLMRWGGFAGHDPKQFGALWAHANRLAAHPAVARAIEREKLQLEVAAIA
jgi:glutathione S-transferase